MESSSKNQLKVGLFLTVGLLMTVVTIFMIGGDRSFFTSKIHYVVRFDQTQGLSRGSMVSLSGLDIGNIEKIDLAPEGNLVEVTLLVEKRYANRITASTQAEIRTQGALGDKYIFLLPGQNGDAPLKDGDAIQVAKATDLFGIFAERGKETSKIFDIITELHKITLAFTNDGRLEKIMTNMAEASSGLKTVAQEAKGFTETLNRDSGQKLKDSMEKLDRIIGRVDRGEGTLGALINDSTLHERLKSLLGTGEKKQQIRSLIRTSIEKSEGR